MNEAIVDTGPIRHLHEIDRLPILSLFQRLTLPDLVQGELQACGIEVDALAGLGLMVDVVEVDETDWRSVASSEGRRLQPADAQVFVLAQRAHFSTSILTEDLALRRSLEAHGARVVGTVGLLVRAYAEGMINRQAIDEAVDALFTGSTLYTSRAFREYVRRLLAQID